MPEQRVVGPLNKGCILAFSFFQDKDPELFDQLPAFLAEEADKISDDHKTRKSILDTKLKVENMLIARATSLVQRPVAADPAPPRSSPVLSASTTPIVFPGGKVLSLPRVATAETTNQAFNEEEIEAAADRWLRERQKVKDHKILQASSVVLWSGSGQTKPIMFLQTHSEGDSNWRCKVDGVNANPRQENVVRMRDGQAFIRSRGEKTNERYLRGYWPYEGMLLCFDLHDGRTNTDYVRLAWENDSLIPLSKDEYMDRLRKKGIC